MERDTHSALSFVWKSLDGVNQAMYATQAYMEKRAVEELPGDVQAQPPNASEGLVRIRLPPFWIFAYRMDRKGRRQKCLPLCDHEPNKKRKGRHCYKRPYRNTIFCVNEEQVHCAYVYQCATTGVCLSVCLCLGVSVCVCLCLYFCVCVCVFVSLHEPVLN